MACTLSHANDPLKWVPINEPFASYLMVVLGTLGLGALFSLVVGRPERGTVPDEDVFPRSRSGMDTHSQYIGSIAWSSCKIHSCLEAIEEGECPKLEHCPNMP